MGECAESAKCSGSQAHSLPHLVRRQEGVCPGHVRYSLQHASQLVQTGHLWYAHLGQRVAHRL